MSEEMQAKRKDLKKMIKPEWESMSQEEKYKDPQYCQYIYEELLIGLEYAKECRKKVTAPDLIDLFDTQINIIEAALNNFVEVE